MNIKSLLVAASLTLGLAAPAFALDCDIGQSVEHTLDFVRNSGKPVLPSAYTVAGERKHSNPLRVIAERCIVGKDDTYALQGVQIAFKSKREATDFVIRALVISPYTAGDLERLGAAMKFVAEKKKEAEAKQAANDKK